MPAEPTQKMREQTVVGAYPRWFGQRGFSFGPLASLAWASFGRSEFCGHKNGTYACRQLMRLLPGSDIRQNCCEYLARELYRPWRQVTELRRRRGTAERVVIGNAVWQRLHRGEKLWPRVDSSVGPQLGVQIGQCARVAAGNDRPGNRTQVNAGAHQPGYKGHSASGAVGASVGGVGLVHVVRHSIPGPGRSGREVTERVVANDRCAPPGQRFAGADAAEISSH